MQSLPESAFRHLTPIIFRGESFVYLCYKHSVLVFSGC